MMRWLTAIAFSMLICAAGANICEAQVFGHFYPARTLGEGGKAAGAYFVVADNVVGGIAQLRYGATPLLDLGLQIGAESIDTHAARAGLFEEEGGSDRLLLGLDAKYAVRAADTEMPVDISINFGLGFADGDPVNDLLIDIGGQVGWRGPEPQSRGLEPYAGLVLMVDRASVDLPEGDYTDTDTDLELRIGTAYAVSGQTCLLAELQVGDGTLFGVGIELTF